MHDKLRTGLIIAIFVLLFTAVGWLMPAMYASYAPNDHFIEANDFVAPDVSTETETHHTCFNRTVHRGASGTVITELYLVPVNGGEQVEVLSEDDDRYIQQGEYTVSIEVELPEDLHEGTYRYRRVYTMELSDGRISRTFVFDSEEFTVTNGSSMQSHHPSC